MKKINEDFDFGFTIHDEELVTAKEMNDTAEKLQGLRNMIMPLLNNLKKNPDKDYINWPNRTKKIDEFIAKMDDYIQS